ncbi:hypothetical protein [Nonomuraea sp. NPDC049695]|uniref:hypothetical protein n=1 Tax=Nonomuraea sp. NPDC049695 TaxID=3154734 RepID=UPI003439A206
MTQIALQNPRAWHGHSAALGAGGHHGGGDPAGRRRALAGHLCRTQDAYELARSAFERFRRQPVAARNGFPYDDLEDFVARGSALAEVVPVVRAELG